MANTVSSFLVCMKETLLVVKPLQMFCWLSAFFVTLHQKPENKVQRDRFDFGTLDHHSKGDSIEAFSSSFNPTGRQNITNCRVSWLSVFSLTLHVKPEIKVQRGRCDFGTLDHHSNGNSIEVFFVKFQPDWSSKHYKMQGFGSL